MATITETKTDMVDVIISDGYHGHDEQIPADVIGGEMHEWLEDWMAGYTYLTEDADKHTATVNLQVIDTDTRDVLYTGDFEVATTLV